MNNTNHQNQACSYYTHIVKGTGDGSGTHKCELNNMKIHPKSSYKIIRTRSELGGVTIPNGECMFLKDQTKCPFYPDKKSID